MIHNQNGVIDSRLAAEAATITVDIGSTSGIRAIEFDLHFRAPSSGTIPTFVYLLPNGLTTGLSSSYAVVSPGAVITPLLDASNVVLWTAGEADRNEGWCSGKILLGEGFRRVITGTFGSFTAGATNDAQRAGFLSGTWDDTSTTLTSLVFSANAGTRNMGVGSYARVTKIS